MKFIVPLSPRPNFPGFLVGASEKVVYDFIGPLSPFGFGCGRVGESGI